MTESIDRRILGAFRCVDSVTKSPILEPIAATSNTLLLRPNRSHVFVIFNGPGFLRHTTEFLPSAAKWPPPAPFEVELSDPRRQYLPRRATLHVPQKLGPASDSASVFKAQQVTMYRSSSAPVLPNWAVVRVSVSRAGTDPPKGLPWCILRITDASDSTNVLTRGMTDRRGEALLAVTGIGVQVSGNGSGSVVQSTVDVSVGVWFDPDVLKQPDDWLPDPDTLFSKLNAAPNATEPAKLGAGTDRAIGFSISL